MALHYNQNSLLIELYRGIFDIAIKINPQDYHNYFYRAKYFIIHEQFNKAKQDLEMALKIHKNDPDIIMTFGVMNYLSKNYMESLKYCKNYY